uniref:Uncharacterized protein n=1 Tax=Timema bartmani TaxID=61472 RepID=A0A7R9FBY2_9NEOP|nr:unnamed protein product [Timema bartmani]
MLTQNALKHSRLASDLHFFYISLLGVMALLRSETLLSLSIALVSMMEMNERATCWGGRNVYVSLHGRRGSNLSPEDCGRFQILQFHTWFHRGVAQ